MLVKWAQWHWAERVCVDMLGMIVRVLICVKYYSGVRQETVFEAVLLLHQERINEWCKRERRAGLHELSSRACAMDCLNRVIMR